MGSLQSAAQHEMAFGCASANYLHILISKLHKFHFNAYNVCSDNRCCKRVALALPTQTTPETAMDMTDTPHLTTPSTAGPARTDAAWLEAHWMPYTGNRQFKAKPRLMASAKGAYFTDVDGKQIFDGLSGLWCTGLGHGREEITRAVAQQMGTLDYSPAFQFGHSLSFELANQVVERMPAGLSHVFFTGSGSESADTSLKMARAYWRTKGMGQKTRLIGRVKGYHGVNFGGISVGRHRGQPQAVWPRR
jgi:4-aminobutyrate aminotransferase-like enzyme